MLAPAWRRACIALGTFVLLAFAADHLINWEIVRAFDFSVVWKFRYALLAALGTTLWIAAVASVGGFALGVLLALAARTRFALLRWAVIAYVELWRNTPLIVQLLWVHFALPVITGIKTTALVSGVLALTLQAGAYFCEVVRAGIGAVPRGQSEAAEALGIPARVRWLRIIMPQALRIIVPPLTNLSISLFKVTSVLSILQIGELMSTTNRISNYTFKPIEMFTAVAIIYFGVGDILNRGSTRLEAWLESEKTREL
jgi:polar amino acid transport system permease protein